MVVFPSREVQLRRALMKDEVSDKVPASLLAYGTFNIYEIKGKAYYHDGRRKVYVRAPERDFMVKQKAQGVLE